MDIFPSFPSLLWSLPEIHQVSVEVGSMCAKNTRWNSQGIQRGIFIRAWYKWCTSKCVPLDSLGENSIDIISITILTRLHPLIDHPLVDQWETLSKIINYCAVTSNARSKSVHRSPREFLKRSAQEWSKKAARSRHAFRLCIVRVQLWH